MSLSKIFVVAMGLAIATGVAAFAYAPANRSAAPVEQNSLSQNEIGAMTRVLKLADQHADNCKANYDNCVAGCGGATSCTNQCKTNYDECMGTGQ